MSPFLPLVVPNRCVLTPPLMTPLLGADGETYAIAQGSLVVGGLGVTGNDGSSIVNVPTVGRIPRGAFVEGWMKRRSSRIDTVLLNLHQGDFSTAMRVADAVNGVLVPMLPRRWNFEPIKVRAS